MGFGENERAIQIDSLMLELTRVINEKVSDEEHVRDEFVSSVEESRASIQENAARLGEQAPNLDVDEDGHDISELALTEQNVYYQELGKEIEAKVAERAQVIMERRAELLKLSSELGEELEAKWLPSSTSSSYRKSGENAAKDEEKAESKSVSKEDLPSDLTDANLQGHEGKVLEMRAMHAARVAEHLSLTVSAQELLREMAMHLESEQQKEMEIENAGENAALLADSGSSRSKGSCWTIGHTRDAATREFDRKILGSLVTVDGGRPAECPRASLGGGADPNAVAEAIKAITVRRGASETSLGISAGALAALSTRYDELVKESDARRQYLIDMGEKLSKLWELLSVSAEEQAAFDEAIAAPPGGMSLSTIQKGEVELERLQLLKTEKMVELVSLKRSEIERLWVETSAPKDERDAFESFHVNDPELFTDVMLEEHEAKVAHLEKRLETMQPLLTKVKKYQDAVEAREKLEEFKKDKERLKGRGASKQLKLEEEMGKKIKQLPKIIASLTKQVKEWEAANGGATFYAPVTAGSGSGEEEGEAAATAGHESRSCLAYIEETEHLWKAKKDGAMADKKAAKDKERLSQAIYHAPPSRQSLHGAHHNDDNAAPQGATRNGGKRGAHAGAKKFGGSTTTTAALGEVTASRRNSGE